MESILERAFRKIDFRPDVSVDDLIHCALELDHSLSELYRELAGETFSLRVQELFTDLLEMERSKDRQYTRSALVVRQQ